MKTCTIDKSGHWSIKNRPNSPHQVADQCILATALNKRVDSDSMFPVLANLLPVSTYQTIRQYYYAICRVDEGRATPQDINIIKELAKKLKIKLVIYK